MIVSDASVTTPNMRWTMTSAFGMTEVFVTASVDETATTFEYGKITTLATGTQNQETIGAADFGEINGNEITIKLSLDKVNSAVGSNVFNTTSTNTQAEAQILIGSSLSGGLLLNSDQATGSDFDIGGNTSPTPTPTPNPTPTVDPSPSPSPSVEPSPTPNEDTGSRFDERYSGTLNPGEASVLIPFDLRRSTLDAQISQNHGNQSLTFELLSADGTMIATGNGRKILLDGLATGSYAYRVRGTVGKPVDFTIKSGQGN
jgi:hypothetical protein